MELLERIIERVSPTRAQGSQVQRASRELLSKVQEAASGLPVQVDAMLVGSVAKQTYIYPPDIDVFVLFPPDTSREELERHGLAVGREVLGGEERYAEHPYIHGRFQGFEVDVVPCYAIPDPSRLKSAVDRTPFHTHYVLGRLRPEQRDQVRLLKRFMKGVGTYGAEAKVQGFSGYLVELLILRYGDFQRTIEECAGWMEGTVLSMDGEKGIRFSSPLVFYDPIDPRRNVASALSQQCFATYVHACRQFLEEPREEFFFPRPARPWSRSRLRSEMKRRGTRLLAVRLARPSLTDDNLFPQVRKTLDGLVCTLESGDFLVLDKAFSVERGHVHLLVELQTDLLPRSRRHTGPPVTSEHAEAFLAKWKDNALGPPFIENGRWMVVVERSHRSARQLVQERLMGAALGSDMKELEAMKVLSHEQLMRAGALSPLSALLDKTFPWER